MPTLDKIECMIDTGWFVPPDTFDDLPKGIEHIRQMATGGKLWHDLPDPTKANLLRWVREALDVLVSISDVRD